MAKKKMTLTEQLMRANSEHEGTMLFLLDTCSNIHFLTLSRLVATKNINVIFKVLERKKLHPLVHRVLLHVTPECLHEMIKSRPDYKTFTADDFLFGCDETYEEAKARWIYEPICSVCSAEWMQEFYENKDDKLWQDAVVHGRSLPHIIYMIENCEIHSSVLNQILNFYGADADGELSLYLQKHVPIREYIHELKPGEKPLDSIREKGSVVFVEYDISDTNLQSRILNGEVQLVREFVSEEKEKVWAEFCDERMEVFKKIKRYQKLHPFTEMFICWQYFAKHIDLEAFKIFYDVEDSFPESFEWMMSRVEFEDMSM